MNKRQKQKAETREKILEIARSLFSRKGFEVSMRFLANEAGISVGSLFVHFKDKHDLLVHVLYEDLQRAGERALQHLSAEKSVLDNLIDVTRPVYEYYLMNPELSQVLLKESMFSNEDDENPLIRDQLYWFLREIVAVIQPKFKNDSSLNLENFMASFFSLYFVNLLKNLKKKDVGIEDVMADLVKPLEALTVAYDLP